MDSVKDYIESARALQQKFEQVRRGFISRRKSFEEQYQPITEQLHVLSTLLNKNTSSQATSSSSSSSSKERGLREVIGDMAFDYLCATPSTDRDTTFGLRIEGGKAYLGSEQVFINRNVITVKGENFKGTEGLWRLLTLKEPKDFTKDDLNVYEKLVLTTSTYRQNNDPNNRVKSSSGMKYKKIIQPILIKNEILKSQTEVSGSGLEKIVTNAPVEYVFWNSLDELLDRLYIVYGEIKAGNTNPSLVNEIISILEEIREI